MEEGSSSRASTNSSTSTGSSSSSSEGATIMRWSSGTANKQPQLPNFDIFHNIFIVAFNPVQALVSFKLVPHVVHVLSKRKPLKFPMETRTWEKVQVQGHLRTARCPQRARIHRLMVQQSRSKLVLGVPGVYFTIEDYPIHKQFRRVMRKYAEDRGLDPSDKWVYYGDVVQPEDTPASLRMVEDPLPRIELIIYRKVTFPDPFSFSSEVRVLVVFAV
ncbi:hypothetical protein BKA70DRAFT_1242485 [Coprinopsis sp. MPI-PUGE-AT-0042]|nr:hypothetical protein BKA70DRAFT_1242485 [Coprinopsis sp. MPI-PUGE-AT-0042]